MSAIQLQPAAGPLATVAAHVPHPATALDHGFSEVLQTVDKKSASEPQAAGSDARSAASKNDPWSAAADKAADDAATQVQAPAQTSTPAQTASAVDAALAALGVTAPPVAGAAPSAKAYSQTSAATTVRLRLSPGPAYSDPAPAKTAASLFGPTEDDTSPGLAPAVFDLTGATPLQAQLASDPTLGFQSLQARTHLAVTDSVPVKICAPTKKPNGTDAPAGPSPILAANTLQPHTHAAAGVLEGDGGNSAAGGDASSDAGHSDTPSQATDAVTATATAQDAAATLPAADAPTSVPLANFPAFVADQAAEFVEAETSLPSSATPKTATPLAPQAVKELEISLHPADLGAVTLQMRLANGKLSVVIGVSNPSTMAAMEGDRDAIAERLGATQQQLEGLTIRRMDPASAAAAAADPSESDSNSSNGSGAGGDNGSSRKRDGFGGEGGANRRHGGAGGYSV